MKLTRQDILLIIIGALVIWNIISTKTSTTDVDAYKETLEKLQKTINDTKQVNEEVSKKVDKIKDIIIPSLQKNISKIDNNIGVIKKRTDEKVNNVDTLSRNELERFFSNRYNKR